LIELGENRSSWFPVRLIRERLIDIQEAIAKIEKYAVRGRLVFFEDELIQIWIVHHLLSY
jgi:hypothetical protein